MAKKKSKKKSSKGASTRSRRSREPTIPVQDIPLHQTAQRRYLNYAMSVITARALPDVRDGLKPVQRRILYTMQHELRISPGSKPLKCARIVGDVLGKFHPHGDVAVYEALVRMAQNFSLRLPLIDGHGNFGSVDGDPAAAYRYTEATLESLSMELLGELSRDTVDYRPNYDGKTKEPVVLPARYPNLLVNGATGIAVGMATNIPPHNLGEVLDAAVALIEDRSLDTRALLQYVKGPDFPLGGQILNSKAELRQIYEEGQGSVRVRGTYAIEEVKNKKGAPRFTGQRVVISSIPYMTQKDAIVRAIGDLAYARKLPQVTDVRDESTDDIRVVIELKKDADCDRVLAYLYKNTALQSNFAVNLTCLVPVEEGSTGEQTTPAKVDLQEMLSQFVDFRYRVVERRFSYDLRRLEERIHILEGFQKVFDLLDEAIRIIRRSDGRADASVKLQKRFELTEVQALAILDLRLYRLAKLEIQAILEELREKVAEAKRLRAILKSPAKLWAVVKAELVSLRAERADKRRTRIGGKASEEVEFSEEDFIVEEDSYVILSQQGWIKRSTRVTDISKIRLRQGDALQAIVAGDTRQLVVFFSNFGSAYTTRIHDIPASRGHGDPIQKLFKFRDGEKVVLAVSLDPRCLRDWESKREDEIPKRHVVALTARGQAVRFGLGAYAEPSTRSGRRFARLREGDEVVGAHLTSEGEVLMVASRSGRVLLFDTANVKFLSGPGLGVLGIKLDEKDRVLGTGISSQPSHRMTALTTGNRRVDITTRRYKPTSRGGKGVEVIKRGGLKAIEEPEIVVPDIENAKKGSRRR